MFNISLLEDSSIEYIWKDLRKSGENPNLTHTLTDDITLVPSPDNTDTKI